MIGSHNTFSYLPTTKWWMKLLTPWHKCQQWNVINQVAFAGVGYLDIRVRFNNYNEPVLVHNNITYQAPNDNILYFISDELYPLHPKKPIPCRLILDERIKPGENLKAGKQLFLFKELIDYMQNAPFISNLLYIDEARIYWDWQHPLIKSKYNIQEIHTSVCSPWYKYILGTKWFAKRNNKSVLVNDQMIIDNKTVYLIDYVNIK